MITYYPEKERAVKCCQLAISKDTGRLKWYLGVGRKESKWQQKRKIILMLTITIVVLLLVGLVFGAVSHFHARDGSFMHNHSYEHHGPNIYVKKFSHDSEGIKLEDRDLMQDIQTKFAPPAAIYYTIRQKRSISDEDDTQALQTYQGNVSSDLIIWDVQEKSFNIDALNGGGHIINSAAANQPSQSIAKVHNNINLAQTHIPSNEEQTSPAHNEYNEKQFGKTRQNILSATHQLPEENSMGSQEIMLNEAENYNKVAANYPDEATDADYEMDDTHHSHEDKDKGVVYIDPVLKEDHIFPRKSAREDIDENYNQPQEEVEEEEEEEEEKEEERYSLEQEAWLALQDYVAGENLDLHTFWKGEGDFHTIRHAQAKIMSSYMDVNADPCQDFYQYACGNWGKKHPIPKDKTTYDTFEILRENLDAVLKELLEEKPNTEYHNEATEVLQNDAATKAKHFFQSCMNYEILKQRAEQPLLKLLDQLGGWPMLQPDWDSSQFDWLLLMAKLRLYNNDILISQWVGPDIKNSNEYVIQFDQTSLGLPTRDYFVQPSNMMYLEAYKSYLIKISTLLGAPLDNAIEEAEALINFETRLAEITSGPDERRNVSELYQRISIGQLMQLVPEVDWARYLSLVLARPINISEPVVVFALNYIQNLVTLLHKTPSRTVANYLLWRFVRHRVNNLDDRFQEAKQQFYHILFGREKAPSRWKNCVAEVNHHLGMAVGAMFVHKYFDENSKRDTVQMTEEIMQNFQELLSQTSWIDTETKELAAEKVDAMALRIGYPDYILNPQLLNAQYEDLLIHPDQYFENVVNILQHLTREEQSHLGTPVNKSIWNTAPAVVNAYYSRNKNQIMFPAGILQPPFYHHYFPRSLNYGGIGVVIGHEITHGFDDKGRLFDKDGNLHRWWNDEAIEEFNHHAQCLIDQYSHYTVKEAEIQIDGISTQGENIADNGGIKQAFRAYQRWLNEYGDFGETLPGINATGHQLFFLNFAQIWCGTMRPEATRNILKTAVHSPGKFRVIGTLSNSEDFALTFKCQLGMPMNPIKKCSVW